MECCFFKCETGLGNYTDPMLFPDGTEIASSVFSQNDETICWKLLVDGEINVKYIDNINYFDQTELPDKLKQIIKEHPFDWERNPDVNIIKRNCYVLVSDKDDIKIPFEEDARMNMAQKIFNDMYDLSKQHLLNRRKNMNDVQMNYKEAFEWLSQPGIQAIIFDKNDMHTNCALKVAYKALEETVKTQESKRSHQIQTERGLISVRSDEFETEQEAQANGYYYIWTSTKLNRKLYSKILDKEGHRRSFAFVQGK